MVPCPQRDSETMLRPIFSLELFAQFWFRLRAKGDLEYSGYKTFSRPTNEDKQKQNTILKKIVQAEFQLFCNLWLYSEKIVWFTLFFCLKVNSDNKNSNMIAAGQLFWLNARSRWKYDSTTDVLARQKYDASYKTHQPNYAISVLQSSSSKTQFGIIREAN